MASDDPEHVPKKGVRSGAGLARTRQGIGKKRVGTDGRLIFPAHFLFDRWRTRTLSKVVNRPRHT
jgi:hypothetical protein